MPRTLRLFWYRVDKAALAGALFFALVVGVLVPAAASVFNQRDAQHGLVREFHARSLDCLARNVYYEARGESLAGQYAVAEVTLNRKASPLYPRRSARWCIRRVRSPGPRATSTHPAGPNGYARSRSRKRCTTCGARPRFPACSTSTPPTFALTGQRNANAWRASAAMCSTADG